MTQEKIKQELKEILHDVTVAVCWGLIDISTVEADLLEAKSSAKKLIEKIDEYLESLKPEFKVGDYIATKRYVGVISRVDKVPSDYDCDLYTVGGLFYDKYLELIGNARLFPSDYLGSGRIPTKEEIAEYEVALTFLKHDRKPFELKRGDIVHLKGYDKNIFLDSENIYKKHNFINGDVVLVKTVEEVNEWLENK